MARATQGQLEKLRLGKVINNTAGVAGRNIILLLFVGALFFGLPVILVNLWAVWYWPKLAFLGSVYGNNPVAIAANVSSSFASGLLATTTSFLGCAVLSRATVEDVNRNRPSVAASVGAILRHCLPIMGIGFAMYLVYFAARFAVLVASLSVPYGGAIAFILLIVPCVTWGLGISVAVPVAIQEDLGTRASMSRSRLLTRGCRWPILGLLSIIFGLWFVSRLALAFAFRPSPAMLTSISELIVGTIPSAVVSAIIWTVTSIAIAATYIELRRTKEGDSVDKLAEIFS